MTDSTTTEAIEYAVRMPDGSTRPLPIKHQNGHVGLELNAGSSRFAQLLVVDGKITPYSIGEANEKIAVAHRDALKALGHEHGDDVPVPLIVERRVLTVTDPWSLASATD